MKARAAHALVVAAALLLASPAFSAAAAPQIPASWVEGVTANTANLRAEIDPGGLNTTYRFEYLSEAAYEVRGWSGALLAPPSGSAPFGSAPAPPVFRHLEHLTPATEYRYRPVAINEADTTIGPEHILATEEFAQVPTCDNDAYRVGGPGSGLPDCRAYELVSPIDKGGGSIASPASLFGGNEIQAAASGSAITYGSASSFAAGQGAPPASQYISRRTDAGWGTENISTPLDSAAYGERPDGAPYRLFSTDLARGLLFGGEPCRGAFPGCPVPNPVLPGTGAPPGYMAYYLRDADGALASLLDGADLAHSAATPDRFRVSLAAATPDLSHLILSSCAALTDQATEPPAAPGECSASAQNLYEWSGGDLRVLNLLPGEAKSTPGAQLAAPLGALSADGARVYFTTLEDGPLYLSEAGAPTKLLPETQGGGARFQASSADGSLAFFIHGGELYRYSASTQSSAPIASGPGGVLAVSADGARVYFQDANGLKEWHEGALAEIAPGPDVALPSDYPPSGATVRLSPDGLHLAFLSNAEIPPFDNLDADTGQPDTELYLYGPPPAGGAPRLICASCNPTGERPRGSASIPGALVNGSSAAYKPRSLSADGRRVFFDSSDRLVTADTDSRRDVYQWEADGLGDCDRSPGCLDLISGGRSEGGTFLDASADGSDAYFLTGDSLIAADPGSIDLYDARIGGGLPEPPPPFVCLGDACQALPNPPDDPTPGTAVPNSGNPARKYFKPPKKRHHRKHRHKRHHRSGR